MMASVTRRTKGQTWKKKKRKIERKRERERERERERLDTLTQMPVLVVIPVVHSVLLERMLGVVAGGGSGQVAGCEAQTD